MAWKEFGKLLIPDGNVAPVVAQSENGESMTASGLIVPKDTKAPEPLKPNRDMRRDIMRQIKAQQRRERRRKLRTGKVVDDAVNQLISIQPKPAISPSE